MAAAGAALWIALTIASKCALIDSRPFHCRPSCLIRVDVSSSPPPIHDRPSSLAQLRRRRRSSRQSFLVVAPGPRSQQSLARIRQAAHASASHPQTVAAVPQSSAFDKGPSAAHAGHPPSTKSIFCTDSHICRRTRVVRFRDGVRVCNIINDLGEVRHPKRSP